MQGYRYSYSWGKTTWLSGSKCLGVCANCSWIPPEQSTACELSHGITHDWKAFEDHKLFGTRGLPRLRKTVAMAMLR